MADDLPTSDDHHGKGLESDLELDTSGFEPGLELDKSGFEPEPEHADPEPVADGLELDTTGFEPGLALDKSGFETEPRPPTRPSPPPPRPPPVRPPGPPTVAHGRPAPNPRVLRALAVGAAVLFAVVLAATWFSEPAPPVNPIPQQALEEGERAFHQGKWVEALVAFRRLHRFPNTAEAESVRERRLEERAFKEIMQAEPSPATVRRLEELFELYPDRLEVRDRLGDVRKALSSGARVVPEDEGQSAHAD